MNCITNGGLLSDLTEAHLVQLINKKQAIDVPMESTTIYYKGCGMRTHQDLVDDNTCNMQGVMVSNVVLQTKIPEDWTTNNKIKLVNQKLQDEEVKISEGLKYPESKIHGTKCKDQRHRHQQELMNCVLNNKE